MLEIKFYIVHSSIFTLTGNMNCTKKEKKGNIETDIALKTIIPLISAYLLSVTASF